jgi:YHS domain-containing protein
MERMFVVLIALIMMGCATRSEVFVSKNGRAINGYDPVAYFLREKPVKGMPEFKHKWNGATWYFSSLENKEAFIANPEGYAPQFGGYCAFGVSNGYKAPTDPEAWTILNNKLYLNYNTDVRDEWFKEKDERIRKANSNWDQVKWERFN